MCLFLSSQRERNVFSSARKPTPDHISSIWISSWHIICGRAWSIRQNESKCFTLGRVWSDFNVLCAETSRNVECWKEMPNIFWFLPKKKETLLLLRQHQMRLFCWNLFTHFHSYWSHRLSIRFLIIIDEILIQVLEEFMDTFTVVSWGRLRTFAIKNHEILNFNLIFSLSLHPTTHKTAITNDKRWKFEFTISDIFNRRERIYRHLFPHPLQPLSATVREVLWWSDVCVVFFWFPMV